jgi:hypothetical protein
MQRRFLIWIGSDQEKTFGPTIAGLIRDHVEPERMILWDSKQRGGRPDTVRLLRETWDSWGAEVIFITSNWQGNEEMMQGCAVRKCFSRPPINCRRRLELTRIGRWIARVRHAVGLLKPDNER